MRQLPLRVKLEMFFRLTGNISYPLMIVASFMQFPLLLVRYNQGLVSTDDAGRAAAFLLDSFGGPLLWHCGWFIWIEEAGSRLLHLPLVMGLGIGLAFSNARAVFEALAGIKSEFVRTPKYQVENIDDESWKQKKYKRKHGWLPLLELSFAVYFVLAIAYAVQHAHVGADRLSAAVLFRLWLHGNAQPFADRRRQAANLSLAAQRRGSATLRVAQTLVCDP